MIKKIILKIKAILTKNYSLCLKEINKCFALLIISNVKIKKTLNSELRCVNINDIHPNIGRINNDFQNPKVNENIDLTIIIPVFNVEDYITECIESILSQKTNYNFKLIIINDGSSDDSENKMKPYLNDVRITYIYQKNQGQSVARNSAINLVDSKFIMFVDADDFLLPNAIETLLKIQLKTNADIVEGCIHRFSQNYSIENYPPVRNKLKVFSYKKTPNFVLPSYGYSVAKIYRRELWNNVRYPESYIFEDIITKFVLRCKANICVFTDIPVYAYRWNPNSSSHDGNIVKKLDAIWVLDKVLTIRKSADIAMDETLYLLILNHVGILNNLVANQFDMEIQNSIIKISRDILEKYQKYKPKKMPVAFKKLEESILSMDVYNWNKIVSLINKNELLKKWREIN